jgi:UMF1 family MFS transporter
MDVTTVEPVTLSVNQQDQKGTDEEDGTASRDDDASQTGTSSGVEKKEGGESASSNDASSHTGSQLPRGYPHWQGKPMYGGNQEALGWAFDVVGRGIAAVSTAAYLSTTLLRLATITAYAESDCDPSDPGCDPRVYGIKPSSLLTTYSVISGALSALLAPLMGAVVDYSMHRLRIGKITSAIWCTSLFVTCFIGWDTWFPITVLLIVISLVGWVQTLVTHSYLPELTKDKALLNKYTSNFTMIRYGSMVCFLLIVKGLAAAFDITEDYVATTRMAQGINFGVSSTCLFLAYAFLFKPRPEARKLPEGQSIWTAGFSQILRTTKKIYRRYHALKWFYIAVVFGEAAVQSLVVIVITYLTNKLKFNTAENGWAVLAWLVGAVPGGFAAGRVTALLKNPIRCMLVAMIIFILVTFAASLILKGPDQKIQAYVITGCWGVAAGWKWTTDRLLSSTLIPKGQHAELMGYFLFAGECLTWLPPLIYTWLNEAGVPQRYGLMSLNFFFFVAGVAYLMIGSYEDAVKEKEESPCDSTTTVDTEGNEGQDENSADEI